GTSPLASRSCLRLTRAAISLGSRLRTTSLCGGAGIGDCTAAATATGGDTATGGATTTGGATAAGGGAATLGATAARLGGARLGDARLGGARLGGATFGAAAQVSRVEVPVR